MTHQPDIISKLEAVRDEFIELRRRHYECHLNGTAAFYRALHEIKELDAIIAEVSGMACDDEGCEHYGTKHVHPKQPEAPSGGEVDFKTAWDAFHSEHERVSEAVEMDVEYFELMQLCLKAALNTRATPTVDAEVVRRCAGAILDLPQCQSEMVENHLAIPAMPYGMAEEFVHTVLRAANIKIEGE